MDVYDHLISCVHMDRRTWPLIIDSDDGACVPPIWICPYPRQRPVICNNLGCSEEGKEKKRKKEYQRHRCTKMSLGRRYSPTAAGSLGYS